MSYFVSHWPISKPWESAVRRTGGSWTIFGGGAGRAGRGSGTAGGTGGARGRWGLGSRGVLGRAGPTAGSGPLLAARKAAEQSASPRVRIAAFDAERLRRAWTDAIDLLASARVPRDGADRRALRIGERHAQAKTRRTAAIAHALAQVERAHLAYRSRTGGEPAKVPGDGLILETLRWRDQQHRAIGAGDELAVEEVSRHGAIEARFGLAHDDRRKGRPHARSPRRAQRLARHGGVLMAEEDGAGGARGPRRVNFPDRHCGRILLPAPPRPPTHRRPPGPPLRALPAGARW